MRDIWISLFIFGVIFFNWPVISMFEHGISTYLFAAWFLFIALVVIAVEYKKKNDDGG
jgi:uncharacterized membrane protein HdeD (DUF308 family)